MKGTFDLIVADLLRSEGGFAHRSRKADPGGATMFGITQGTLSAWRGRAVSVEEVKALSQAEAINIYQRQYWEAVQGDELPRRLDYALFDFAVNSGPARAVKTLQMILGVGVDGVPGVQTLTAIRQRSAEELVHEVSVQRLAFMKRLRNWSYNKNGWSRRVREVQKRSLELTRSEEVSVKPLRVFDGVVADGAAKARGEELSLLSAWLTPEGLSKAGVLASGVAGMLAGSGPLQWAFAFVLVIAASVGGFLMVQKERRA